MERVGVSKKGFYSSHQAIGKKLKPSLYGSIKGIDVKEEVIERAKKSLFRNLEDI